MRGLRCRALSRSLLRLNDLTAFVVIQRSAGWGDWLCLVGGVYRLIVFVPGGPDIRGVIADNVKLHAFQKTHCWSWAGLGRCCA